MKKDIIKDVVIPHNLKIEDYDYYTSEIIKIKKIVPNKNDAKVVIVTAMNPTPIGEGKTTTSIGLVDGLNKIGINAIGCLREPSMGPVFGLKGTGSGSNKAILLPFDKINLHFTGDLHAISSANNLISAVIENEIFQNSELNIDPNRIIWKRCLDVNDRSLRDTILKIHDDIKINTSFNITAASDMMSLLCLSKSKEDFLEKLESTIVAYNKDSKPITIKDLEISTAILTIMEHAFYPNLVRTLEDNPIIVHGGPFANISNGCSSIMSIKLGMKLGDIVVTEAGFGSDLGLEKFMDITSVEGEWTPNLIVLVISLKSILYNGNGDDENALNLGFENVKHHIEHAKKYGVNLVIAINHRSEDNPDLLNKLFCLLDNENVSYALSDSWSLGSDGAIDLANLVINEIDKPINYKTLYKKNDNLEDKINLIAKNAYGSLGVKFSELAQKQLDEYKEFSDYYVCIAKNPYSLTCDQKILGRPKNFYTTVESIDINHAAKLIIPITSVVYRMPGLPKKPAAKNFVLK